MLTIAINTSLAHMKALQEPELVVYCDSSYHEFANGGYAACAAYFKKRAVVVGSQHVSDAQEANLAAILVALEYIEQYISKAYAVTVFSDSQDTINHIHNRSSLRFFQYSQEKRIADILMTLAQNKIRVFFRKSGGTDGSPKLASQNYTLQHTKNKDFQDLPAPQLNPAQGLAYAHLLDKINKTTSNLEQYSQLVGDLDDIRFVDTGIPSTAHMKLHENRRATPRVSARANTRVNIYAPVAKTLPSRERVHALVSMFSSL